MHNAVRLLQITQGRGESQTLTKSMLLKFNIHRIKIMNNPSGLEFYAQNNQSLLKLVCRYFSLVVSLRARTKEEDSKPLTVVAHVSERIIVRVSNDVAIALSLVPPMASDIKISCTASASSQATPNNSFQFNVSNEVTSFSVAVAVEKQ